MPEMKRTLGLVSEEANIEATSPDPAARAEASPADVFNDLASLRQQSKIVVKRRPVLVNVTVGKPPDNQHFRVNSAPDCQLDATIIRDTEGSRRRVFFVLPHMRAHPKLEPRLRYVTICLVTTWPVSDVYLWPVPILGDTDFKAWKSARAAFVMAQKEWMQMCWNQDRGDYDITAAENLDRDPVWPEKSFGELLKLGFADGIIDNENQPYVRQLRGLLD